MKKTIISIAFSVMALFAVAQTVDNMLVESSESSYVTTAKERLCEHEANCALHHKIPEGQYSLGMRYFVCRDTINAVKYWRMAAIGGYEEAQFNMGDAYYRGRGVKKDIEKAVIHLNNYVDCLDDKDEKALEKDELKELKLARKIIAKYNAEQSRLKKGIDGVVVRGKDYFSFMAPKGVEVQILDGKKIKRFIGKGFEVADSLVYVASESSREFDVAILGVENITFISNTNAEFGKAFDYESRLKPPMIIVFTANLNHFNVDNNPSLRFLSVMRDGDKYFRELDVTNNPLLEELYCSGHRLTELNLSKNKELRILYCAENELKKLDVSKNAKLEHLICWNNKITSINVTKNRQLTFLSCENNIGEIDLTQNPELETFICRRSKLKTLDISKNRKLKLIRIEGNELSAKELNKIFNDLESSKDPREFLIIGFDENPGSENCDSMIAREKGWGN